MKKSKITILFILLLLARGHCICSNKEKYHGSDQSPVVKDYLKVNVNFDSLKVVWSNHKEIPKEFEKQILIALSHYPELIDTKIKFLVKKTLIPIASRPSLTVFFRSKFKRTYLVVISSASRPEMENSLLKNLPFNAQVGVIGHELAHTVYYLNKSKGTMLGVAFGYLSGKFRAQFEKDTDRRTIDHGLGWQLLSWSSAIRPKNAAKGEQFVDKYYLHPIEIKAYMTSSALYSNESVDN